MNRREIVRYGGESLLWYVGVFLVVLVIVWGLVLASLGMKVATAGLVGKGQAHIIKESAPNRIVQQAGFEVAYADIRKFDQQVKDANAAVADWDKVNANKQDNVIGTLAGQRTYLVQVATGLRQQCQTTVESYNADARKYLAKDFKAVDLPDFIYIEEHCR